MIERRFMPEKMQKPAQRQLRRLSLHDGTGTFAVLASSRKFGFSVGVFALAPQYVPRFISDTENLGQGVAEQ